MEEKKHKQQGGGTPKSSHTPTRRKLIAPKRSVHIKCTHFPSQIGKRLHSLADRLRFFIAFFFVSAFFLWSKFSSSEWPMCAGFFCVGQCGTRLGHRSRITWGCILYSILLLLHLHTKAKILRANLASTSVGNDVVMSGRKNVCGRFVFFFCAGVALCVFHPPEALICQMSVSHEQNSHIYAEFKGGPNLFGTRHGRLDDARKKYLKKRRRFWHASIWNASSPFWPPRLSACNLHFFPL